MKNKKQGFVGIAVIIVIVLVAVGVGVYLFQIKKVDIKPSKNYSNIETGKTTNASQAFGLVGSWGFHDADYPKGEDAKFAYPGRAFDLTLNEDGRGTLDVYGIKVVDMYNIKIELTDGLINVVFDSYDFSRQDEPHILPPEESRYRKGDVLLTLKPAVNLDRLLIKSSKFGQFNASSNLYFEKK